MQTAVELGGQPFPAEDPDRQKGGFQEKGQGGLDGQQRAEDVPHILGVAGPVGAELKFQGDAGHHPHGEVDNKDLSPEFGHPPVVLVAGSDVDRLHNGDEDGKPQGQRHEEKMEKRGAGELQA